MKFFRLTSAYLPGATINNFDSLMWTERYQDNGDFQLVVSNEISILQVLPLGALVSHTDTFEVMMIENHQINRDSAKNLTVTISGRTLETFAENRPTIGSNLPVADINGDNWVETSPTTPACHFAVTLLQSRLQPGIASSADAIPNVLIYENMRVHAPNMTSVVKRGDMYARVLEYLRMSSAGIKTMRPHAAQTTLDIVVHDGRSFLNVVFRAQSEDLDDAAYFWSIKNYSNYAAISTHSYALLYRDKNEPVDLNGLERRIIYVDADDIVGTFPTPSPSDEVGTRAQSVLDEHPKISLFQATISKTAKPKFKFDYDVGDLVTVFGEFETSQKMRVTEHILTVDKDGMRGFPSLNIIE